jgi:CheY-like chemotaxis protein
MTAAALSLGSVLVVDDDAGACRTVETVLRAAGYEAIDAQDGDQAIDLLRERHFDVVLTDLIRPHIDGLELLDTIRSTNIDSAVLVMSSEGSIPLAVQAIKRGAINYIEKPIVPEDLLEHVREAFEQRRENALQKTLTAPRYPHPMGSAPSRIARYEVKGMLGSGGMGAVYLAQDPQLGRLVAIKTIRPPSDAKGLFHDAAARFLREAKTVAQITHPNIAAVYDLGTETSSGLIYLAMEYVPGLSLDRLLADQGALPLARALNITFQVADALACAHRNGVVHRDVKPANVIVSTGDHVKLLDFGVARVSGSDLTRSGLLVGSPGYFSPEAARGERVDHRSDQFGLGILLLEMIFNQRIFSGEDVVETMHLVMERTPPLIADFGIDAPAELQRLVDRLTHKRPSNRYMDEHALLSDLARVGRELGLNLHPAMPHMQ